MNIRKQDGGGEWHIKEKSDQSRTEAQQSKHLTILPHAQHVGSLMASSELSQSW